MLQDCLTSWKSDEVLFLGTKRSEEGMRRVMRSNEVRQQFGASISEATF